MSMSDQIKKLPRHVAIIMDGNGRWAKAHALQVAMGHRKGVEALRDVIRESSDIGIEALTLYAFSTENWRRSEAEVSALMNLLLEYVHCSNFELSRYEELLKYIESMERTMLALAKIYPKTVYYYYLAWEDAGHQGTDMALRMLELCDKAIEILRDANRMFYMWELFGVMERLVPMLPKETRESEWVQTRLAECLGWKETLEEIYRDYGVSIAMYEFCYLYVGSENYCIGDVVRIRRKMLGLSQKRLCKNICDERTLGRLEKNETRPQREVVQYLFDRLNLSTELCRTVLVTDSQEAIEMYREINKQNNNWNFEQVEMLTKKLRKLVSLDIPSNKQALERNEVLNLYKQKIISKLDYIKKMKEVLENTVPYKAAIKNSEKYLTNEEIACLQNITLNIGWENAEMQECVMALVRICEMPKYPANYVRVYEFVMGMVSSYLGDKGEYDYSNRVKNNIVAMALKNRRIKAIDSAIYGMLWNREQESKKDDGKFEKKIHENELKKCIRMSSLCKSVYRMNIYERKIHEE